MSETTVPSSHDLRDFPDWFDPALVKDLRRGLKMRGFTATYLCLISAITLLLGGAILTRAGDEVMNVVWFPVAITLMLIQPMRGATAIVEERKLETLPLIQLTRLSALRILFGKWMALAFQTLLISVSLLPYMVLGHFLGGFEFAQNVLLLLLFTVLSLVLTAATVALSVVTLAVLRSLITIALFLFVFQFTVIGVGGSLFGGRGIFDPEYLLIALVVATAAGAFMVYYLLSAAASQVALPGTENHSTRRRLVALGVVALCCLASALTPSSWMDQELLLIPIFLIVGVVIIDCLVDPAGTSIRTAKQFLKWRVSSSALAPGWPFGWLFAMLLTALGFVATVLVLGTSISFGDEEWGFLLAGTAALFVPGAIAVMLPKGRSHPLNFYLLGHVVVAAVAALVALLSEMSDLDGVLVLTPYTNMALADGSSSDTATSIVASCVQLGFAATVFVVCGAPYRQKFRKQFVDAAAVAKENS